MQLYHDDAHALIAAEKELFDVKPWERKASRDGRSAILQFVCRVRVSGTLPQGLRFRVVTFSSNPNTATFQLEMEGPSKREALILYRLDWRPPTAHGNGRNGPRELWDLVYPPLQTHEHVCTDHLSATEGKVLRGGVQAARKIEPDFEDYIAAFRYVCDRLKIVNGNNVPEKDAQPDFF